MGSSPTPGAVDTSLAIGFRSARSGRGGTAESGVQVAEGGPLHDRPPFVGALVTSLATPEDARFVGVVVASLEETDGLCEVDRDTAETTARFHQRGRLERMKSMYSMIIASSVGVRGSPEYEKDRRAGSGGVPETA